MAFVQKRDADGDPTRKKARITAGDLVARGRVPDTYSANLAVETSRYMAQLELQMEGARTTHKDVGGATPDRVPGRARHLRPHSPGWAGLGTEHGMCFEEVQ